MVELTAARAWCNNEVAYVAWRTDEPIEDCLGFAVTRVLADGTRRALPTWVAFDGQSNPHWEPQDCTVWPIQKFQWRDLTLRRSRDSLDVRADGFSVSYEIAAVGRQAEGLEPVPEPPARAPRYTGTRIPLAYLGPRTTTEPVHVGLRHGQISVAFNNGILATQNLRKQLGVSPGRAPSKTIFLKRIATKDDPVRRYFAGDVLPLLRTFFDRAHGADATIHAALYELDDAELVDLLLANRDRLHLILSTAGVSQDGKTWDTTNADARAALRTALGDRLQDRMFNNSAHIGHNKFAVLSVRGKPTAVWTGSTNWTPTGLCGQTNNALLIVGAPAAGHYRDYWDRLHADVQPVPVPLSAPNSTNQGQALRTGDAKGHDVRLDRRKTAAQLWFSPNTPWVATPARRTVPPDLQVVFQHMKAARQAILFLVFNPGRTAASTTGEEDVDTVVSAALDFGRHQPGLFVKGTISDPTAMPGYVQPPRGVEKPKPEDRVPSRAIYSPPGAPNILIVRATSIGDPIGDFQVELLTAGNAIIHDKVVVVDPFDEKNCVVVTGSHNLGFKASYANDENLVIVKGNAALAQAYAVHVLDVFEHFKFRSARIEQQRRQVLARLQAEAIAERAGKAAPAAVRSFNGYLDTDADWQQPYFSGEKARELDFFLGPA